ncbi:MAG: hypothetical protein KF712_04255 [Akkermansiaceae bacterium]|nr:hypothetical protein [Akkermansiaceae bacterium]
MRLEGITDSPPGAMMEMGRDISKRGGAEVAEVAERDAGVEMATLGRPFRDPFIPANQRSPFPDREQE